MKYFVLRQVEPHGPHEISGFDCREKAETYMNVHKENQPFRVFRGIELNVIKEEVVTRWKVEE